MTSAEFRNIVVMPVLQLASGGDQTRGGPIWPDWQSRTFERHCRDGRPGDQEPVLRETPEPRDWPNAYWGGFVNGHFGHQIADFSMRILPSLFENPNAELVFSAQGPGAPFFFDILTWCGLPRERLHIVSSPIVLDRLRVLPQAEQLYTRGPSDAHLDAVDRFIAAKGLNDDRIEPLVYVSRAGVGPRQARFAGEIYIEDCARRAGAMIFRPEKHPVETQLRTYLAADRLVFSEGSSLHLLQLAGRNYKAVDVLVRRRMDGFRHWVEPRAEDYRAVMACKTLIRTVTETGMPATWAGITMPDIPVLLDSFAARGCDLRPHFDPRAYVTAAVDDIMKWIALNTGPRKQPNWRDSDREVAALLDQAGVPSLAAQVRKAIV